MEEYEELREEHYANQEERHHLPFEKAQAKGKVIDFGQRPPVRAPASLGVTVVTERYSLEDVLDYIDWNPFFQAWELRGRYPNRGYPKIFKDETVGEEAKKLFNDAQAMLMKVCVTFLLLK